MSNWKPENEEQMKQIIEKWSSWSPYLHGLLRIVAAFMFLVHGSMKLFAIPAGMGPNNATVHLMSQIGLAGILEFFGGLLMLFGLYARPAAFILSGLMAVAYFQVHFPRGYWPGMNGGELAVLYCFIWLYFSASGAGALSLDALRKKQ